MKFKEQLQRFFIVPFSCTEKKLLIAEFAYNRLMFLTSLAVCLMFLLFALNYHPDHLHTFMNMTIAAYIVVIVLYAIQYGGEKRDRLFTLMPVPQQAVFKVNMAFILFVQAVLTGFWLIVWLLHSAQYGSSGLVKIWTGTVFLPMIFLLFSIAGDLKYCAPPLPKIRAWLIAATILLLIFNPMRFGHRLVTAAGITSGTLVLTAAFYAVSRKRQTWLE